jgi:hypothetical protein
MYDRCGLWRSWLAHMSGGHGVASSSLASPNFIFFADNKIAKNRYDYIDRLYEV